MVKMAESRTVKIYGESYTVRSDESAEYIEEVAAFVDGRMREIAGTGKIISTDKIAILAFFSLLHMSCRQQPNLVLIITDDQGYGDLSLHGNTLLETPNLDEIGLSGVRLDNFHVSPVCAPLGQLCLQVEGLCPQVPTG